MAQWMERYGMIQVCAWDQSPTSDAVAV